MYVIMYEAYYYLYSIVLSQCIFISHIHYIDVGSASGRREGIECSTFSLIF